MKIVTRVLIIIMCLFAAIGCYVFGVPAGGIVFVLLGLIFEGMFWLGIFAKKNNKQRVEIK